MRKIFCIIMVIHIVIFAYETASADIEPYKNKLIEYGVIVQNTVDECTVSRGECIVSIMKLIGLNDIYAATYATNDFETLYLSDVRPTGKSEDGYILFANHYGIVYGLYDEHNLVVFNKNNNVTLKECIAFMMRCLDETIYDIDEAYVYAKNIGFISETDLIGKDENSSITMDDFCILLNRMLYRDVGKYCKEIKLSCIDGLCSNGTRYEVYYDNEHTMKYIDRFENNKKEIINREIEPNKTE